MPTYAIGDLQGCLEPLQRLLDKIRFDPARDSLWFTGDLVNRGPNSLGCLRLVRELGDSALTVLGNHDLHLLAMAHGVRRHASSDLDAVLDAPDAAELLHWLQQQALLHHDETLDITLVHAGLPPEWDIPKARVLAREVETVLRAARFEDFFEEMYGAEPARWSDQLTGIRRLRYIVNALTRIRFVDTAGRLDFEHKGPPGSQPDGLAPWYAHPNRASRGARLITGHWSALGARGFDGVYAIDGGCVWGNELVALRLDQEPEFISVDCPACG